MKLVFTPDWFLDADVLTEGFSFIVLFIFFLLCIKNYKLNKKRNFLYLGIGFLLIAIAQLSVILTKVVLYYDTTFTHQIGMMVINYKVVSSVDMFYSIGFFLHKILTLLGFYIIYRLPVKKSSVGDFVLALYFIILSALVSSSAYYLYHLTVLVLLALIINNYVEIYKKNKSENTKILILALGILALGHLIFIMSKIQTLYVTANLIQLVSYIILLFLITRILKNPKR